jgi:hypothetical protein
VKKTIDELLAALRSALPTRDNMMEITIMRKVVLKVDISID